MIDETKEAKKYKEKQENRRYVWHYNLDHAPTYARAYFKRELEKYDWALNSWDKEIREEYKALVEAVKN